MDFFHPHPLFVIAWMSTWIVASLVYRAKKGTRFPEAAPETLEFEERWTSGHSLKNLMTRMGGARNCLWVMVTGDEIWIRPHFPGNLGFLPEVYDLEHRIAKSQLTSVQEGRYGMGRKVVLEFSDSEGKPHRFELLLRDPERFIEAARPGRVTLLKHG